ncbi:MAG TPA: hypothetical protein VFY78_01040 [Gammaproteobacteria bacterium]|nr:hypothetical protein [Gammaproteobacteria bacterium]
MAPNKIASTKGSGETPSVVAMLMAMGVPMAAATICHIGVQYVSV